MVETCPRTNLFLPCGQFGRVIAYLLESEDMTRIRKQQNYVKAQKQHMKEESQKEKRKRKGTRNKKRSKFAFSFPRPF